jgi:hypothetical protein
VGRGFGRAERDEKEQEEQCAESHVQPQYLDVVS